MPPIAVQSLSGDDDVNSTCPIDVGLEAIRDLGVREVFPPVEGEVSPGVVSSRPVIYAYGETDAEVKVSNIPRAYLEESLQK